VKFSDKLQKIRKENNITQEGLADKLNVSRQAVSKWESGLAYPDTEKLIQISRIFKVSLDELINDDIDMDKNKDNIGKKISFMEIFDMGIEFISKSVNMFWSMKFLEKIKCLFEMGILILIIVLFSMLSISILVNILRRILVFLPGDWIYNLCLLFETILLLGWIVLGIIIVVKMFKMRYLDYYVIISDDSVSERIIEEPIKELKEKKEYKIVIRDPDDSSLRIFSKLGKLIMFFIKVLSLLLAIPLVLLFIFCMVILVFSLFYIFKGLFFNGISVLMVGIILFMYLMLEFIYNLIFDRDNSLGRMFLVFIVSISLIGVGIGLSFVSLSNFSYEENSRKDVNMHNIEMVDNLVLYPLIYEVIDNDIVIDNSLDNIKLEITSYGYNDIYLYSYDSYDNRYGGYKVIEMDIDYNEIDMYKGILKDLEDKRIVNYDRIYDIKMYVSNDNLTKLRENIDKYYR